MNILFVHQNHPGQYREILRYLAAGGAHRIVFLTQRQDGRAPAGVHLERYQPHHRAAPDAYALSRVFEDQMGAGWGAYLACRRLDARGFRPDIVIGHLGWGELVFLKQLWPGVPILAYLEYYYRAGEGPNGFDPETPAAVEAPALMKARNALSHLCLEDIDLAQSPTRWQMDSYPAAFQARGYICHDGIRSDLLRPDADVRLPLARLGRDLSRDDEIVTFMARNLEPTRGFHRFMRTLALVLERRPRARALIVGGNGASYGAPSRHPGGFRGEIEAELGDRLDWDRIHFLGRVGYHDFNRVIQISRCHVYLSQPFVLSWSLLEAMAMEAVIVAADTAPVREVIADGESGLLVDYFDAEAQARAIAGALADPGDFARFGRAARERVRADYDFHGRCLPEHLTRLNGLLPAALRLPGAAAIAAR